MLKQCLCDDREEDLERLEEVADGFFRSCPDIPVCVQSFRSPFDLLEWVEEKGCFDRYLLLKNRGDPKGAPAGAGAGGGLQPQAGLHPV